MVGSLSDRNRAWWRRMEVSVKIDDTKTFRLIELSPSLETSLRENTLTFRSDSGKDSVYLCTKDSTHQVRKLKQSNTLLFGTANESRLDVFASPSQLLEALKIRGRVNWDNFPEYLGKRKHTNQTSEYSCEYACSPEEFLAESRLYPAVTLDSRIFKLAPRVVHDVLVDIVSAMVEKQDMELTSDLKELHLESDEFPEVIEAVFNKFRTDGRLDVEAIGQWVGLNILRSNPDGMLASDLVKEWSLDLPIKMNTDLSILKEFAIETKPGWIQYLDSERLSSDPRTRIEDLFAIKREWTLESITPFIEALVPATQKIDNWILKFARKRRAGAQTFIIPMR